jgi:putative ABC transport system permease protein
LGIHILAEQLHWRQAMNTVIRDIRQALHLIQKRPGASAIVVLSLALGIGVNATIFSATNVVLFRPVPYPESDRLVAVWFLEKSFTPATRAGCRVLRQTNSVFEDVGCMKSVTRTLAIDASSEPIRLPGQELTPEIPQVLRVPPFLGRWFTKEEESFTATPVVVLSHKFWNVHFGGDRNILGKDVLLGNERAKVIGIAPPTFEVRNYAYLIPRVTPSPDFWVPRPGSPNEGNADDRNLTVIGRLKEGVTVLDAQRRLTESAAPELHRINESRAIQLITLADFYSGNPRAFAVLHGIVALVLLIACCNLAGLMLAEATHRQREFAIRAAIGSNRWELIKQFLTQSMLLAVLGGFAGVVLAGWVGPQFIRFALPAAFPSDQLAVDWRVVGFSLAISLAAGFLVGFVPALQFSKPDILGALQDSGRGPGKNISRLNLRSALVMSQVALSFMLLTGAVALIRSLSDLYAAPLGFEAQNLMTFQMEDKRSGGRQRQLLERLAGIPGIESAASTTVPSWSARRRSFDVRPTEGNAVAQSMLQAISPRYFETMKTAVVRGREFSESDRTGSSPVAIVNSVAAKRFWPDANPIGKYIRTGFPEDPPREVIGVVADIHQDPRREELPQVYVPEEQLALVSVKESGNESRTVTYLVRSHLKSKELVDFIRRTVIETIPGEAIFNVESAEESLSARLSDVRQTATLLGVFGIVAVALSIIGIYGIMEYTVGQRTRELGLRIALGSTSLRVLRLVIGQGLILIGSGAGIGAVAAYVFSSILASSMQGIQPADGLTYSAVALLLGATGLVACYFPARKVFRIDPGSALRWD